MDVSDLKQSIDRLTQDTNEAAQLIDSFPNLRRVSGPNLSLANIDFRSTEAKSHFRQALSTLCNDTKNMSRRVALPVVIGFMGAYGSGKSSLLNAFFAQILETEVAALPANLRRKTGNTATDTKFTYITHEDFADTFPQTNEIAVATSNNPLFRTVNFIDTPGTGWKTLKFLGDEVSNLLSSADIMLFLFDHNKVLDAMSTEALNLKFTQYREIPVWYVVTHALLYCTTKPDYSTIDDKQFLADLERAKELLHERECKDDHEAEARDRVWSEVTFDVGENTFLVDSPDNYGIEKLFTRLLQRFSSPETRERKLGQIAREVQSLYQRLDGILAEAESHISRLALELRHALVGSIERDIATLRTTIIASNSARLSQEMFARLRQDPPAFGALRMLFSPGVPASLTNVAPQIQILKERLSEMHQERHSPIGVLQEEEILFPTTKVITYLETLNSDLTNCINKNTVLQWDSAGPASVIRQQGSVLIAEVASLVDPQRPLSDWETTFKRTSERLYQHMRQATERLVDLYNADEMEKSIFKAQKSFLSQLEVRIPAGIQDVSTTVTETAVEAKAYVQGQLRQFGNLVEQRDSHLGTTVASYLNEQVYRPTSDALDFLFDRNDRPTNVDQGIGTITSYRLPLDQFANQIETSVVNEQSQATETLNQIEFSWSDEWGRLNTDFDALIKDALTVATKLRTREQDAANLLEENTQQGLGDIRNILSDLRNSVIRIVDDHKLDAEQAMRSAERRGKWHTSLEIIALIVAIAVPTIELARNQFQVQNLQFWPSGIVAIVAVALATWMISLLVRRVEAINRVAQSEYAYKQKGFVVDVQSTVNRSKDNIQRVLMNRNASVKEGLSQAYDGLIEDSETANRTLLERLDGQIKAAAGLSMSMTKQISTVERQATSAMLRAVNSHLNQQIEEAAGAVERNMNDFVEVTSRRHITLLNEQISRYTELSNRISRLRHNLQSALVSRA